VAQSHSILREGTTAGLLGGAAVALWFLVRDTLSGLPLRTPSVLGEALVFGNTAPDIERVNTAAAAAYTVVHFGVFMLVGLVFAALMRWATREPVARFAVVVAFVVFVLLFYVVLRTGGGELDQLFPAWLVLGANLLAAAVMGFYFWRRYPEVRRILDAEPLGS
jgi:hypothetical protein